MIAITFSANCVNAESVITMDNLKNQLEGSSIIKGYNATLTVEGEGRLLYIETDDLQVSFCYVDDILKYSGPNLNMSIYLLNQASMTKEEFVKRSQKNTKIVSEIVACIADLYGLDILSIIMIGVVIYFLMIMRIRGLHILLVV